jgi:acetylornithine deacetylase/succinyl-diaminopimelate desuccinylase-like protein
VRQIVSLLPLMLVCACARAPENSWESLGRHLTAGAEALAEYPDEQGGAFELFLRAAATSAARGGDADLAAALGSLESGRAPAADQRPLASRVLRRYVVARYGERMAADLSEMVRFRTFHVEGRDNWDAPEFVRQREWLERKARQAGLEFRSYDGRVEEITLDGSGRVLGILTHGDVQGVEGQTWSAPPWEGRIENDRIVGRGAEDDKGPIVTTLYVFAAFADSGWLDGVSLRLIVSNGEECCWTEIPYYLERADPPDVTIGFDASYPVTHAQKAWSVMTVTAPRSESRNEPASGWRIVSLEGGSGLSIIPERGELVLQPLESALAAELAERAATWAAAHPPARLEVTTEGGLVRLTATGRGGHSSEPEGGHNALGDLAAFVFDSETELHPADRGALVRCMGRIIGTETHGERLGISHTDPVMGSLTVNLALFDEEEGRSRASQHASAARHRERRDRGRDRQGCRRVRPDLGPTVGAELPHGLAAALRLARGAAGPDAARRVGGSDRRAGPTGGHRWRNPGAAVPGRGRFRAGPRDGALSRARPRRVHHRRRDAA